MPNIPFHSSDRRSLLGIERLVRWLEQFKSCFGHRAQLMALRTYVQGVFSDSERKSMQAMLARVTEPIAYQAFQHFITHAPWDADRVWRRLRKPIPERRGVLILDGTSFPKQGPASVGVARLYCGALGKIANCQVATTAALWTGGRAWFLGAILYLPEAWLTPERRQAARIPAPVRFQEKWRHALRLLRQVRAAGFQLTAVLADAEFGDVTLFRAALHRLRLPYALGISSTLTVFIRRPRLVTPVPRAGRRRHRSPDECCRGRASIAASGLALDPLAAMGHSLGGALASLPCASRQPGVGAWAAWPPTSGSSANGNPMVASSTTSSICRRAPPCVAW